MKKRNSCWICKKIIDNDEEKVRDHCHVTGKFRGTAHWDCNINLQLTKKIPVILYNLRGYNSDLIFSELDKFDAKTRKDFYSSTKDEKIGDDGKTSAGQISIKDYLVCEKIWDKFNMKNTGDYHDHYLKKDVLLSADVFENLIATCLKFYGLDPCHYFSSPGLSYVKNVKNDWCKIRNNIRY